MKLNRFTSSLAAFAFGTVAPVAPAAPLVPSELHPGKAVYDQHCAACHGVNGDGNGPATVWLFPKPRNFNSGLFKIQSTPAGALPTDEDLFQTITRGMPGSSMPSFTYLPAAQRRQTVEYVKWLTATTDASGKRLNKFEEASANGQLKPPVAVPPEPALTVDALAKGKEVYTRMQCAVCHGEHGQGDGPSAPTLKDNWGLPLLPRDFNIGAFRGGSSGRDLYLRINNGLAGTPMLPFGEDLLTPEERWCLVLHIQSLRRNDVAVHDLLTPEDSHIHAPKIDHLPTDPVDPAWERLDPVRVPLNPLWPESRTIYAVAVRAMHDGMRAAILVQWRDSLFNGAPIGVDDFQDGAALQFSMNGSTPFLGMGDAKNPVNLWFWRAGWQQEVNETPPDMDTKHPSMHVDTYFQPERQFRTAQAAGNILAQLHKSAVEDANARGFGTLKAQDASGQNVTGKGVWRDGFWNVVFIRTLNPKDADDVSLAPGKETPIAFAVWDGAQRDRDGRKEISNWYQLVFDR